MKGISRISKELNIETHLLREWEKRHWLGDVLKDPEQNNQRVYDDEQVERIKFIWAIIQEQRKKGFKRTDIQEVEEKLLDKFGGMVKPIENNITVHPGSMDQVVELIQVQNKKISQLESTVSKQANLPDNSEALQEIKEELEASKKREKKQEQVIEDMNEKLQKAVNFIMEMEEKQQNVPKKKTFWTKIFGD
jgi:DNA-binding transcriptional MerR regulator